jgi:hypothetical protein
LPASKNLNPGVYLRPRSNLLYQKFLKKSIRSAPPPAVEYGGLPRRKIVFTFSDLRAPPKNSSKKEKTIFLLGSALNARGGGATLRLAGKNGGGEGEEIFARSPSACGKVVCETKLPMAKVCRQRKSA